MEGTASEWAAWSWYRDHNASIVSGYLDSRDLAESEPMSERFFLNVVLLRVLYAHALVAAPALALGRFAVPHCHQRASPPHGG